MNKTIRWLIAMLAVVALVAAACGDDDTETSSDDGADTSADGGDDSAADDGEADDSAADDSAADDSAADDSAADDGEADDAMAEDDGEADDAMAEDDAVADDAMAEDDAVADDDSSGDDGAGDANALDTNGDGRVVFGIAAAGPHDDGAYYQAVVDAATEISADNGFSEPIVVDNVGAEEAGTAMSDLAQQGVDVIIVGASEIAEPLPDLIEQFPDIFWYCNCGAGFPENPGLAQSLDDGSEIGFTAGYATGLKLQETGGDDTVFIGCCDLGFEKEAFLSFQMGLQTVDPAFTVTYVPTGDFPFDFDNVANATEALTTAIEGGSDAVYPYLGGAHRPVVEAAEDAGLITMSAGSSSVCDASEELPYDIAVRFDGGDYVRAVIDEIVAGTFTEGSIRTFKVGVDDEPGAIICGATAEQQAAMDDVYAQIANGDFAADFGAIKGEAYAG